MNIFTLSCKESARLFIQAQEQRLAVSQYIALVIHRFACTVCRRYWKQVQAIQKLIHRYTGGLEHQAFPVSSVLSEGAKDRIKQSLKGI